MFVTKKCLYLVFMLCFLISSFSFHLLAEEGTKKAAPDRQQDKSQQEQVPAQGHPKISFDSTSYDAGEVWEGDKVSHTFIVKNTGVVQLDIAKVKPG